MHAPFKRLITVIIICAVALIVWLGGQALGLGDLSELLRKLRTEMGWGPLLVLALIYATCLALPYVPGMELGLLLMVACGQKGIAVVYVATLAGLSLSYAVGHLMAINSTHRSPVHCLVPNHGDLGSGAKAMIAGSWLAQIAPHRLMTWLAANRYLALALCLNLPGNAVFGGGGGIALICGWSRKFSFLNYLFTVAAAVSPLPLLMLLGWHGLQ